MNGDDYWLLIIIIAFAVFGYFTKIRKIYCYVCNIQIKRKAHNWKIDDEFRKVCPNCNSALERKQSRLAIKKKFGK